MRLKHYLAGHFDLTIEQPDFIQVFYQHQGINAPLGDKGLIALGIGIIVLPTGNIALRVELAENRYIDDDGNVYFLYDPNEASEIVIKSAEQDLRLYRVDQRS